MGYKLLGFVIWQGAKLYLRRRMPDMRRKAAIAGLGGVLVAGALVVQRQQSNSDS